MQKQQLFSQSDPWVKQDQEQMLPPMSAFGYLWNVRKTNHGTDCPFLVKADVRKEEAYKSLHVCLYPSNPCCMTLCAALLLSFTYAEDRDTSQ